MTMTVVLTTFALVVSAMDSASLVPLTDFEPCRGFRHSTASNQGSCLSPCRPRSSTRSAESSAWSQIRNDRTRIAKKAESSTHNSSQQDSALFATVLRLASRAYNATSSKPSSKDYTTAKVTQAWINLTTHGVEGDYNHYRTVALKSTPNRALSILTQDVMDCLAQRYEAIQLGDLGENVLMGGVPYSFFQIGKQYQFNTHDAAIFEITEPMVPCANLCSLPFINDDKLTPRERVDMCKDFLEMIDLRGDGFRGWYAKVVKPGVIHVGEECAEVIALNIESKS